MIINGKEAGFKLHGKTYHCAMDITMDYIGGKWKSVILWYLRNNTMRFMELKQRIPDITEKMLSLQLKALEGDGLIQRASFGTKPPLRVEYSLTEFGKTLIEPLETIARWGRTLGETAGTIQMME
ncbi:helix-turn-helix transcriptional regulator [Pseudoflavitalea sp. G-6-1-2]|uniref:winged helix-turn-helix transcriptional regulator n=1 Tax=Pseudoflavitalea sp. G-6-1-2 TaxID=2728841 RepID=UPI00146E455C|nr:helix-turn-helix domain-containing protein [Pseudoflavitalea sp. G-6-1-2]NML23545.1 helix-turn-helix transcriptional regulator [Pseudoflavitalea sp. G-6-1-2]